jgi:hypothetical protein
MTAKSKAKAKRENIMVTETVVYHEGDIAARINNYEGIRIEGEFGFNDLDDFGVFVDDIKAAFRMVDDS